MAPLSESKNHVNSTPSKGPSSRPPNRTLDFSMPVAQENRGISPHKTLWDPSQETFSYKKGKNKRPFDLSGLGDEEEKTRNTKPKSISTTDLVYDDQLIPDGDDTPFGQSFTDEDPGNDSVEQSIEHEDQYVVADPSTLVESEPTPRLSGSGAFEEEFVSEQPLSDVEEPYQSAQLPTGNQGSHSVREETEVYESGDEPPASAGRRKGRPKKAPPKKKAAPKRKTAPPPRPQARATSTQPRSIRAGSNGPSSGRSYFVSRSETPATDDGVYRTRSGRTSYKPLAGWRGEKAVYGQRTDRETPASLTDIIRTDEIQMPPPPRRKAKRKVPVVSQLEQIDEELEEEPLEEAEQDLDPWETETGIRYGLVMSWDQEAQKYDEENDEETGKSNLDVNLTLFVFLTCA